MQRITNGRLVTMEGQVFENGFIDFEDGKILALGNASDAPAGTCDTFDAQGGWIMPGFVDAHAHIGISEESARWEGEDCNEITDPITPQMRTIDGVYPHDIAFRKAINGGVTSALVGPGSANVIGGQMAALKMYGDRVDGMIIKAPCVMKMAMGENPKNCYGEHQKRAPMTRMATAALMREAFIKTREYMAKKEQLDDKGNPKEVPFDPKFEALIPVMRREMMVHVHVHRSDDILTAIRIMEEFGLWYTTVHTTDGKAVVPYLKAAGIMPITGPFGTSSKPETDHLGFDTPGVLHNAGIEVCITMDHPVNPLQYLSAHAALAVREGMDEDAALRAITINAAKVGCIEDRVGSLKVGKDADICVYSGHPFEFRTQLKAVWVSGQKVR